MDQRRWAGITTAVGVAAFVLLGLWGWSEHTARTAVEATLTGNYQRAFYATLDNVQNLHVMLGKVRVAGSRNQMANLFSQIRSQAMAAQENLTQLPVADTVASRTAKFLTQVGDFAGSMLNGTSDGHMPDQGQQKTLASLYSQSGDLNRQLREAEAKNRAGGRLYWANLLSQAKSGLKSREQDPAAQDLSAIDTQMQKYPGLIYDGPFSDNPSPPKTTVPGPPTPTAQLPSLALKFLDPLPGVRYQGRFAGSVKANPPAYRVQVTPVQAGADGPVTVDVTATGSHVAWFLDARPVKSTNWGVNQARAKAVSFLAARGMGEFVPTYHRLANNQAIFNLVREAGGVRYYPQQVKVAVALDNGQVVGFEGTGYLGDAGLHPSNKVALTPGQAARLVKGTVAAGPGRLSVIPDGRGGALYAYEFSGRQDGDTYLVYINAENGNEEKILRVADTPGGQLTI